jgi:hypothetical protein
VSLWLVAVAAATHTVAVYADVVRRRRPRLDRPGSNAGRGRREPAGADGAVVPAPPSVWPWR